MCRSEKLWASQGIAFPFVVHITTRCAPHHCIVTLDTKALTASGVWLTWWARRQLSPLTRVKRVLLAVLFGTLSQSFSTKWFLLLRIMRCLERTRRTGVQRRRMRFETSVVEYPEPEPVWLEPPVQVAVTPVHDEHGLAADTYAGARFTNILSLRFMYPRTSISLHCSVHRAVTLAFVTRKVADFLLRFLLHVPLFSPLANVANCFSIGHTFCFNSSNT